MPDSLPSSPARDRRTFWRWVLPFQTMLLTAYIMPMYGFNAFIAPINRIFDPLEVLNGWPGAVAGGLVFLGTAFGAFLHRLLTRLTGSRRWHLLLTNLWLAAALISVALACWYESYWALLTVCGAFLGVALGCAFALAATYLLGWGRDQGHLGVQSGVFGLMFGLWGAVYSLLAPMAISQWGLEWTLVGSAGITVAVSLLSIIHLPESRVSASPPSSDDHGLPFRQILRTRQFWFFTVCMLILLTPGFGFKVIVQSLSVHLYRVDALTASLVAVAFLVSYGVSRLVCGLVADHVRLKPMFLLFTGGQMVLLLITAVGLPQVDGIAFLAIMMCLIGGLFAAGKSLWGMLAIALLGAANLRHTLQGLMMAFGAAGLLGPVSLNWALRSPDVISSTAAWMYAMAGAMGVACGLVWIMRTRDLSPDAPRSQPLHWRRRDRDDRDRF